MKQSPSLGGMTEIKTTHIEVHSNAYWPDDALPGDTTEMADQVEQAPRAIEDDSEYVNLYFVS